MPEHSDRNAEIWSTRVQQELLALTTDEVEASQRTKAMLPRFVIVKEHQLDIAKANCTVLFVVEVQINNETKGIFVQLDASLPKNKDGSIATTVPSYPFVAPIATLFSGQENFCEGSTIQNGERIDMDIEWTPSLTLADAIMNIGLKIKENVNMKEPFHGSTIELPAIDPVDEVAKKARGLVSTMSEKASHFLSPKARKQATPKKEKKPTRAEKAKEKMQQQQQTAATANTGTSPQKKQVTAQNIMIGDEIDLLDEPWAEAHGVYSCKAIRRPRFVLDAMELAEQKADQQSFSSPTAMFRSFTKSARNLVQESFLMITESHIVEMTSSKLNPTTANVTFCIAIELMHKLKFRRHESLSLFFKAAPEEPLIYMCPDSGDAVHQIQAVLKRHGVKGKHTNAAAHRAISDAMQLVQEIQTKELALKHDPSVNRVNEIMDLYRQAAERFEVAGDIRHEEVVTHMRKFLALPLTASILDGSYKRSETTPLSHPPAQPGVVPEGEILPRTHLMLDEDDYDTPASKSKTRGLGDSDKEFQDNIDSMLLEAQKDLDLLKTEDGDTQETDAPSAESADDDALTEEDDALAHVAADLDAMMKQADAELAELLSS